MNSHFYNRMMTGLILVGIGTLFLLDQIGMIGPISWGSIFSTYWPVFIILFSLKGVFFQKRLQYGWLGSYIWNLVALCVGIYFLGSNLGYIHFSIGDMVRYMLPVGLIIFGLSIVFRPAASKRHQEKENRYKDQEYRDHRPDLSTPPPPPPVNDILDSKFPIDMSSPSANSDQAGESDKQQWKQRVREQKQHWKDEKQRWKQERRESHHGWHGEDHNYNSQRTECRSGFIGDMYIGQDTWELKPMNISHFIGDTRIDLTKAIIPYGETRLQISAFIGDVKIYVPDDIDLKVSVTSSVFLGEISVMERYESGFGKSMKLESPQYDDAEKRLRVEVSMFLGDVVVKKVG